MERPVDPYRRKRNDKTLWCLVALGVAYRIWIGVLHGVTGSHTVDGTIGVVLGLYICAHPAANAVDWLFYGRLTGQSFRVRRADLPWLGLNAVTMFAGWLSILIGTVRITGKYGP